MAPRKLAQAFAKWGALPTELRESIIEMACKTAQGDPDSVGSCKRMAKARLDQVCNEFASIASSMQWHHVELSDKKNMHFFVAVLVPKHAGAFRKFSLDWFGDGSGYTPARDIDTGPALKLLAAKHPVFAAGGIDGYYQTFYGARFIRALVYNALRHALTVAVGVESIAFHTLSWSEHFTTAHQSLQLGQCVRKLKLRCWSVRVQDLNNMLRLVRSTLEELRVSTTTPDGSFSCADPPAPFFVLSEPGDKSPALPALRVLEAPDLLVIDALNRPTPLSNNLQRIRLMSSGTDTVHFAPIVDKYSSTLKELVVVDQQYMHRWYDQFKRDDLYARPTREACNRHGVKLKWSL